MGLSSGATHSASAAIMVELEALRQSGKWNYAPPFLSMCRYLYPLHIHFHKFELCQLNQPQQQHHLQ